MKNVRLLQGECAVCHCSIDMQWAGKNPSLGTVCRECFDKHDSVFGSNNVEIVAQKQLRYDPVLGVYEYHFDWRGTRIMVNGKVGVISVPQGDGDYVRFEGDDPEMFRTFINGVGYWDLLRIYKAQGGEIQPPPLEFSEYTPTKAQLLPKPILSVKCETIGGNICSIQVGNRSISFGTIFAPAELPNLSLLHAFANLYVRYKFGLAPNLCVEGGFLGNNFEVRNAGMFTGGVGLSVQKGSSDTITEREQSRSGIIKGTNAQEVLSTWITVMETLLRYDWSKLSYETTKDVWTHYCRMQDVLLNIMTADELTEALAYARNVRIKCY